MAKILHQQIDEDIKQLYAEGLKPKEISEKAGVSVTYVYSALKKHGLFKNRRNNSLPSETVLEKRIEREKRRLEMLKIYNSGKSFADIGKIFGISQQRVYEFIKSGKELWSALLFMALIS